MTLTIGRCSFDCGPYNIVHRGDVLAFNVDIDVDTLTAATAQRQQILGHMGESVSVTWTDDDTWDGFYVVQSVDVSPVATYLQHGLMPASITLRTLRNPEIESDWTFTERVTSPAVYWVAGACGYETTAADRLVHVLGDNGPAFISTERDAAPYHISIGDIATTTKRLQVRSMVPPSAWYWAACQVEGYYTDTWYPVVGRNLPANGIDQLRVDNGRIRIQPVVDDGHILVHMWNGTLWSEASRIEVGAGGVTVDFSRRWQIIENSTAQVIVRYFFSNDTGASGMRAVTLDVVLTRGYDSIRCILSTGIEGVASSYTLTMSEYSGAAMTTTEPSSTILQRSTANADGVTPVIYSDNGTSDDATDTVTWASSASPRVFGIAETSAEATNMFRTSARVRDTFIEARR